MRLISFEQSLLAKYKLPLITVYNSPQDFPGQYVARLFDLDKATPYHVVASSYDGIKSSIPSHMHRLERNPSDKAAIVEVWV